MNTHQHQDRARDRQENSDESHERETSIRYKRDMQGL